MSQTASLPRSTTTPPLAIRRVLRRVDARLRLAGSARGLGTLGMVAAVGLALGMAADYQWTLPIAVRWGIWGTWLAAVALILAMGVLRPLLRRSRWIDLAAVAEKADPRLEERLTGSIALLDSANPPSGCSPALVAALAEDAAGHVGDFDPSTVQRRGRPLLRLALGLVAVGLVAAPVVARPDPFRTLALRFVAPWLDLEQIGRFVLKVRPGDTVAAIGADFAVEAEAVARFGGETPPEAATLEWVDDKGQSHRTPMTFHQDNTTSSPKRWLEAVVPRLAGHVDYRVSMESARSRSYEVKAVEPPQSCEFSARVEPPAYTKLPAFDARDPSKIEAIEGSRVVLSFYSCHAFREFELTWPSALPEKPSRVDVSPPDLKHGKVAFDAVAGGPIVLTLRRHYQHDEIDGLPETRQLIVRPDQPPTLAVKGPASPSEARPDDVLPLGVAARDDFAVASAELHYEVRKSSSDQSRTGQVPLTLEGSGTPTARGVASLSLRDLGLEIGDALSYRVRVIDNRPAPKGPNETWSDVRAISITAKAEPMIAKDDRLRRESFQTRLD